MVGRYFVLLWWHYVVAGLSSPYGRLTEIVVGDRVKWSWEVTCCHFIKSLHSVGGGTWAMIGCCDNVWDLLTSVNDPDHYIRMDYFGHPDVSWKPSGCFMLISVVWPSLRQAGYEGASCVSGWDDPDGMRATCHYEVCDTCSQEEGSLQIWVIFIGNIIVNRVFIVNTLVYN